ncbi:HesB/YadR/YfhF family protein [Metabacillus malikii]|uniref:Uncharacterized protein YneR n=1 Tax=Metabacillus malikii TaxID=1504265 RepID=A0ABT9ZCF4_9BACI|nr:HesB/YadR/YfhF family protein [Metabacillus malikii]MDQ0229936.1 uncharacterized protein YneR [Metabacillus malikii]
MEITIDDNALNWYKDELNLNNGDSVQFFVRYGGCSNVQKGFSLGVTKQTPDEIGSKVEKNGITFFIENRDLWYFDNHNLHVVLDNKLNEPIFTYVD